MKMMNMKDKVAVVTGGALGIGKATCLMLAREGAAVAVTDVKDGPGHEVVAQIESEGGKAAYWHLDVKDEKAVRQTFADIEDRFGALDVLVNNAGISGPNKPTDELTADEWQKVMDVNVNGVFYCTKHAVPYMKKNGGGSIINLSSIYGIISAPDIPPYHASKGAVRSMSKTDALLYAKDRIRVNSVHPGFIWTPLVEEFAGRLGNVQQVRKELNAKHPLGHVGEPDDIANGILYLASDAAKFVTGAELVIDGGYTAQ